MRYAGPVADGNNGMRPARRAVTTVCSHAVGLGDTNRTVKGVMMLRIPTLHSIVQLYPTLHSTVAVFTASFHGFFFARKEKERPRTSGAHAITTRVSTVGSIATRDFKDVRACDLAPLLAPMDSSACISLSLEVRGPQTIRLPPN